MPKMVIKRPKFQIFEKWLKIFEYGKNHQKQVCNCVKFVGFFLSYSEDGEKMKSSTPKGAKKCPKQPKSSQNGKKHRFFWTTFSKKMSKMAKIKLKD